MSPFAYQLRKIRTERQLQQKVMAEIIGCEQSYLSALETDSKVPPQKEKLIQFLKKLSLSSEQMAELLSAAEKSRRTIHLPLKARSQIFEVCHKLEDQLPNISDIQLELIAIALRLNPQEMGGTQNEKRTNL
ncbi:MAG: transcriptional regulator [Methylotenera sp.]|uniref:helix-turn-helix domain-containing protein n=1 Tax=Methylotenera sp. TaxID=2051956 RepID=UPI000D4C9FE5|nr:helix-turn-helix transcriptional regulator [Methylotenera sp.]PPC84777.1 MAG: transcriptional regulator [Methylotenera sp.]PPD02136.1 MAG: transcriptional regulator [Methylotenera sp.]